MKKLLETFGNDVSFFKNNPTSHLINFEKDLHYLQDEGISLITYSDDSYPSKLKSIANPPLVLYLKGNLKVFKRCVAIVGKRDSSYYARKNARDFAKILTKKGYNIVSGLARGIDTEAHMGCLDSKGKTIAVLAGNVNKIYPPENTELSIDILESGAIISESQGKHTQRRFIERNRIISGISDYIIIIESALKGGTVHQFNLAIQQKRPVFVLKPLDKSRISWKGYLNLVKRGGISIESSDDLLNKIKIGIQKSKIDLNRYFTNISKE